MRLSCINRAFCCQPRSHSVIWIGSSIHAGENGFWKARLSLGASSAHLVEDDTAVPSTVDVSSRVPGGLKQSCSLVYMLAFCDISLWFGGSSLA